MLLGLWPSVQLVFSLLIPYAQLRRGASYEGSPPEVLLEGTLPERLVQNALSGLPLFGGALVLTLGALVAGGEYGWGTLKTLLVQGPRRLTVLTGQLLALLLVLAGTVVVELPAHRARELGHRRRRVRGRRLADSRRPVAASPAGC